MTDVAIVESAVIPNVADAPRTPLSWSAAIAGALAAMAVTFIMTSLGSGIGLSFASPYSSGPSATSLTAAAAVWLVLTGRFCARRLRGTSHAPRHVAEMVVTSALIPPLCVFWRLFGALKHRVVFL